MEHEKVYIAIEHRVWEDQILGVYKQQKDAENMIIACGGYGDKQCAACTVWREIQVHDLIN